MKPLVLKPIHLPPDPSWWPPALGWWLLAGLLLLAIALGIIWWRHYRTQRRVSRWLDTKLDHLQQQSNWPDMLHQLLRQALCQLDSRLRTADESTWQKSLTVLARKTPVGNLLELENSRYQQIPPPDRNATLEEAGSILHLSILYPRRARKHLRKEVLHV